MWENRLTEDGRVLDLRGMELSGLKGAQLPEQVQRLTMGYTELTSLGDVKLPAGLKELCLNRTQVTDLREAQLPDSLQCLDLRYAKLASLWGVKLPEGLRKLDLSGTDLMSLGGVKLPEGLQSLELIGTKLADLKNVKLPEGLRELNLSGTRLSDLNGVKLPRSLELLDLSGTNLKSLGGVELPEGLKQLDLGGTQLTELPDSIRKLRSLERLVLAELQLNGLPDWLPELGLPVTRKFFGSYICLYETRVKGIDMSIFDQSQEAIVRWFAEQKQAHEGGAKPLNELKVVFLGDGESGKSHTIARLLNNGRQVDSFRGVSTPGIVIEDKTYRVDGREIKVHFWDFGGQEILHSMHRMFLTKRTLYVVLLNVREGNQQERARYWLHNLRSFANGAPVLLVLNKMDMNRNASVNEGDLSKLYPGLAEVVKLSALTYSDEEFRTKFIDVLLRHIQGMDILAYPFTPAWSRLKEKLQNMEKNYIFGDEFRAYCDEAGVMDGDALRRELLEWFSDLGVSFCYSGSDSMSLEDHVVLRPDWITNAIYVILFNKVHAVKNGLVSHETIYRMLSSADTENIRRTVIDAAYRREEVDYVLKVFRKFRLSFLVEEGVEFLPMLCDANSTAAAMEYETASDVLEFRMYYEHLPDNVIHRLMVDRRKELDRSNVWLTGARFVCGDTGRSAVVKSEGDLIRILVRADKIPRDPQRYLDEMKESLERINAIMGLTVWKMEVVYKEGDVMEPFDYERLLVAQELGETKILSLAHRKKLWLADVLMQSDFPEDEKQKKLRADLRQSCEMLQENHMYWDATEDQRTNQLYQLLTAKGYVAIEQFRTGISAGGSQSGELDLEIRLNPNDSWSAMEALNLTGSSPSQITYWNAHLKKLLDNYNEVGRAFLFHVSYVECRKDRFSGICGAMYEHMRFYSPPGFELLRRFSCEIFLNDENTRCQFLRAFKCVYDCGGVTMTVYHFFVRIGE